MEGYESMNLGIGGKSYSRAHLYGSSARIFGRAHVCRLKADCFPDILPCICEAIVVDNESEIFQGSAQEYMEVQAANHRQS